eukprot:73506-Chlamydomonas_euryale.AAC.3
MAATSGLHFTVIRFQPKCILCTRQQGGLPDLRHFQIEHCDRPCGRAVVHATTAAVMAAATTKALMQPTRVQWGHQLTQPPAVAGACWTSLIATATATLPSWGVIFRRQGLRSQLAGCQEWLPNGTRLRADAGLAGVGCRAGPGQGRMKKLPPAACVFGTQSTGGRRSHSNLERSKGPNRDGSGGLRKRTNTCSRQLAASAPRPAAVPFCAADADAQSMHCVWCKPARARRGQAVSPATARGRFASGSGIR